MSGSDVIDGGLRVIIYGDFQHDRLGASFQRAFAELGHTVDPIDVREMRDGSRHLTNRVTSRLTRYGLRLRRMASVEWNRRVAAHCREGADIFLALNGEWLMPETIRAVRARGTWTALFHADNPFPPHPMHRPEYLPGALEADCYFIWSRELQASLQAMGVRRVEYLPFAWDPHVFPALQPESAPRYDLVFVGGWDRYRERFLEPVARRFDLRIWGPEYWGTRTSPSGAVRRCWQGTATTGHEGAAISVSSKIALNVVREQNLPDGTIMRTFELPGCGAFSLSTYTVGAADLFPPGSAGAYFHSQEECISKIEYYLQHPGERESIARSAHEIVASRHRYVDRAQAIVDAFRSERAAGAPPV
jgi:spore maturation protein CgeB